MGTQPSIAAATTVVTPGAASASPSLSWGAGLAIVATLLLMVGCVVGLGVGWWHLSEHRRTKRCLHEDAPRPATPTTTDSAHASQGVEQPVARPRSPRHQATGRHRPTRTRSIPTRGVSNAA